MTMLYWATAGFGLLVAAWVGAVALCVAAQRGDAQVVVEDDFDEVAEPVVDVLPERRFSRPADRTAAAARAALGARTAWLFSNPEARARLVLRGREGELLPAAAEALALRAAGLAINGEIPVIVPTAASSALGGAALIAVAIPFADGRAGALVVAGGAVLGDHSAAAQALQELAVAHAELGALLSPGRTWPVSGAQRTS